MSTIADHQTENSSNSIRFKVLGKIIGHFGYITTTQNESSIKQNDIHANTGRYHGGNLERQNDDGQSRRCTFTLEAG
jgi:hypothetical protein